MVRIFLPAGMDFDDFGRALRHINAAAVLTVARDKSRAENGVWCEWDNTLALPPPETEIQDAVASSMDAKLKLRARALALEVAVEILAEDVLADIDIAAIDVTGTDDEVKAKLKASAKWKVK